MKFLIFYESPKGFLHIKARGSAESHPTAILLHKTSTPIHKKSKNLKIAQRQGALVMRLI